MRPAPAHNGELDAVWNGSRIPRIFRVLLRENLHHVACPGRRHLSPTEERHLFADCAGFCQRCGSYLFAEAGSTNVSIAEAAHVVAHSDDGPRASSALSADQRDEIDNIVLLCPTCHTLVDKAPEAFPAELLLAWKRDRKSTLARIVGVERHATRAEARKAIERLVITNKTIFDNYGPDSRASYLDDEAAAAWRRKVAQAILPNNRRLLATFDANDRLLTDDEKATVELFRQHVDDLEARHLAGRLETGSLRFPPKTSRIYVDEPDATA